jgi:MFS family permease
VLFGYDIGVISGAILFIKKDFSLFQGMEEIVVSSVLLGSLVGAAVGGFLADRIGRRRQLIIAGSVFGVGAIGAALAPGTAWLLAARIVAGGAIGIASFVAALYVSEIGHGRHPRKTDFDQSSRSHRRHRHLLPYRLRICRVPGDGCLRWLSFRRPHSELD